MADLHIFRTPAAKNFKEKTGRANYRLNTIIVGLESVRNGTAKKPPDLAVGWDQPADGKLAALKARGYATNAFMVYAVDAIDGYMRRLGSDKVWLADDPIGPALRNEFQTDRSETRAYNALAADKLIAELQTGKSDAKIAENLLREFAATHFGRRKRPSMPGRFDLLLSKAPNVPQCYIASVQLLISWRNSHVHGETTYTISDKLIDDLISAGEYFHNQHSGLDIQSLVDRYTKDDAPTLKDISSLISVSHRTIEAIDRKLLANLDIEATFRSAIKSALLEDTKRGEKRLKEYWGIGLPARQRKLGALASPFGFQMADAKMVDYAARIPEQSIYDLSSMDLDSFSRELGIEFGNTEAV